MLNYVPAGVESFTDSRRQLAIVRKPNKKESTEFGQKYKRWNLRDKVVTLTGASARGGTAIKEIAEAVIPVFSATFVKNSGVTKVLANPISNPFRRQPFAVHGIECIVDSGGFQLLRGTVDFVHPDDIVTRYNAEADIGMPLDVPVRSVLESVYFHPISKLIKANDEYIGSRLNKNVNLALISHGSTIPLREARLNVLDRKAEVVAIAGLNIKPKPGVDHVLNNIENLMYVIQRYHKVTRYFHVLGVTSKLWMFMYALIEATGYVREIGADSVTHRMDALTGKWSTPDFRLIQLQKNMPYKISPQCNCPICFAVDDLRLMHEATLLECHNLWTRQKQSDLLTSISHEFLRGTTKITTIHHLLKLSMPVTKFQYLINYVMEVITTDKWRPIKRPKLSKTLFDGMTTTYSSAETKAMSEHYIKVIKRYEAFHKKKFL